MLLNTELFQMYLLSNFAMAKAYSTCGLTKVLYANSLLTFEATHTFLRIMATIWLAMVTSVLFHMVVSF